MFWGADNALKNLCRQLLLGDDCDFSLGYREPVEGSLGGVCILPDLPGKYEIEKEMKRLEEEKIKPSEARGLLEEIGASPLNNTISLADFIKRPEINYEILKKLGKYDGSLNWQVTEQCEVQLKYDGYIKKQVQQVESYRKLEKRMISRDMDFSAIDGLRLEAKQKLEAIKPLNIGQASRISGVSPADISVLLVYLQAYNRENEPTMESYHPQD